MRMLSADAGMMSSHTNHDVLDRVVSSFKVRIAADHVNFFVTAVASADASAGLTLLPLHRQLLPVLQPLHRQLLSVFATAFSGRTS